MSPDLKKRLVTALVAVPTLIILFLAGGIPFLLLIIFVMFAGMWEMERVLVSKGVSFSRILLFPLGFMVLCAAFFESMYLEKDTGMLIYTGTIFVSTIMILSYMVIRGRVQNSIRDSASLFFVHIFLTVPLSIAILLRNFGLSHASPIRFSSGLSITLDENTGTLFLFFVVAVTFLADTGAYFVGRQFGGRRLAPDISPQKSLEGAIGGIITACLTALSVKFIDENFFRIIPDFTYLHSLSLGLLLGVAGIFGDLFESMLKRDAGLKDAGGLLPGHGGIMDRLDSLIFNIPLTYFYVKIYYSVL